jgi:glycosyltransferase involved in cell wall biosynthesis
MNLDASPTVSVIIATYNKAQTLQYAIESVLWQTFTEFECWVIGDGCTDNSEEVVTKIADPRFYWFNLCQNSGYQSAPTNEGLRRARGKYIAYLNDDDIWLPNHLQALVEGLENFAVDFAYTIMEWIRSEEYRGVEIPNYPHALQPPEATATMHRREVIDDIGYWKEPGEVQAIPRVEFFRRAQFSNHSFLLVPYLTALKFGHKGAAYGEVTLQDKFMAKIRNDGAFVEKELAKLLIGATHKIERPLSVEQMRRQLSHSLRLMMIKRKIDPGRLMFWKRSGQRIAEWRKSLGLDTN